MDRTILDNDRKGASLKPSSSSLLPNHAAEAEATSVFHQQMLPFFFLEHLLLQGGSKLKSQRVLSVKQQAFSYLAAKNVIY